MKKVIYQYGHEQIWNTFFFYLYFGNSLYFINLGGD